MDLDGCAILGCVILLPLGVLALARQQLQADRLSVLERRLKSLEARLSAQPPAAEPAPAPVPPRAPEPVPPRAPEPAPPPPPAPPPRPPPPAWTPPSIERIVVWIAASAGGLMVVVAALFALSVVIERGWLGPGIRVLGGLIAAAGLLVAGAATRSKARVAASGLTGAGSAIAFATLYAAFARYHLIPGPLAFAALGITCATTSFAADRQRDRLLAGVGLLGGLLTPILVSTGENRPVALFAYLAVLSVGQLVVAWRRGWAEVALGVVLGVSALFSGWSAEWWAPDQVPVALGGLLALTLPWAIAAGRDTPPVVGTPVAHPTYVRWVAALASVGLPLLALPWVVPVDPVFTDPGGGGTVLRPFGTAVALAALAPSVLLLPAWAAARWRREPWSLLASGAAASLVLAGTTGYAAFPDPQPAWLLAGLVLPALAAAPFTFGAGFRLGMAPVLAAAGIGLAIATGAVPVPGGLFFGAVAVIALLTAAGSADLGILASGLGGLALATGIAAGGDHTAPIAVFGAASLTLGLLGTVPLLHRGPKPGTTVGHALAVLAGPLLTPALYLSWRAEWGTGLLGPVPLIVGLFGALSALAILRIHRANGSDFGLALAALVALGGVTAAIPAQLETSWLTVAWALEAAALAWLSGRLRHPILPLASVSLAVAVACRLVLNPWVFDYGDAQGWLLNWPLYTWGIPFLALLLAAAGLRRNAHAAVPVLLLALAVGFALVNVEVSDAFQETGPIELGGASRWQGMVRSLGWAAYGLSILIAGLASDSKMVRLIGFGFVGLAATKVGIYDVWTMRGFVRVGSLLGLGVSLLLAALLFEWLVIRGGRHASKEEE